jgi:hypothetical protein
MTMTLLRRATLRLLLVGMLAVAASALSPSPGRRRSSGRALPELTSMDLHLPRVDFLPQLIAGDSFRVTFTLDRPAPAGGTFIQMRKLRDAGPIHNLPPRPHRPAGAAV